MKQDDNKESKPNLSHMPATSTMDLLNANYEYHIGCHLTITEDQFRESMESIEAKKKTDFVFDIDGVRTEMTFNELQEILATVPQTIAGKIEKRIFECEDDSDLMTMDTTVTVHKQSKDITADEAKFLFKQIELCAEQLERENK